ncbi:MAG: right-handed parallel beta-helix repeat-containing protein [Armatimonadetes bacterium]|nr:right-handed parallel beta-helix repeat-containing protein [Armatimonadota bacterium]
MLLVATVLALTVQIKAVYVSPTGDDKNLGTKARPFRTPQHAIDAASKPSDGLRRNVVLRGGTYFLDAPLMMTNDHYGLEVRAERNEKPILSAGLSLRGFKNSGDTYTVTVPGTFAVNQLFVDGVRYDRPRLPETGYYHVKDIVARPEREKEGDDRFVAQDHTVDPNWHNLQDVEVVHFQNWTITRFPIKTVEGGTVLLAGRTYPTDWQRFKPGMRFVVDNVKEALKRPGQFYFDSKTRLLSVIPAKGVDLNKAEVVVPRFDRILDLSGNMISFENITFSHAAWTMPPEGRNFPQAEADMSGAVYVHDAGFSGFNKCRITHVGGYGLEYGSRCAFSGFSNGEISDLGAGGVKVGLKEHVADTRETAQAVVIKGNIIAGGGRVHPAGVGVWVGDSPNITVESNEIADFYYTGVSVGWTWGYGPTNTKQNEIKGNHIHDIGHGVLSDMGGVYHLGTDPECQVVENEIHDVQSFDYGGWGLYLDEGSTGVTMARNVVYNCSRQSFHQHYGKDNLVTGNILVDAGESQLARTRAEDHLSFNFEDNIVVWKSTPLLWGNWDGKGVAMDHNLYWRTDGIPVDFNGQSLAAWQALGRDKNSLVADPIFVNPAKHDYRLKPTSPALKFGFKPNDPTFAPKPTRWKNLPPAWPVGR